jgi:hypothetical protein
MTTFLRVRPLWVAAAATMFLLGPSGARAQGNVPPELFHDPHVREELGVNEFTAPSIDKIFRELQVLRPIPYDKVKGPIDVAATFPTRFQLALNLGLLLGEGFLTVDAERGDRIAELGRALLRMSQALGISDRITRHSKSLMEEGLRGEWGLMRKELAATQQDVEGAMMDLRDEEIAHVVALGGWLRGLEIASTTIAERYTPERAEVLRRIELVDYFNGRLDTLHPRLRKLPLASRITADLKTLQSILEKPAGGALDLGDVRQVQQLTGRLVKLIREGMPVDAQPER